MGVNPDNGQPITTNEWIDRLATKAAAVVAIGTCATYGGIPAMKNNPTGAMGLPDYLGWKWKSKAGLPVVCIPGCPAQPDNTTETLLYLVLHLAGMAPMPELDEASCGPKWLFGRTAHESCNRAAFYEAGRLRHGVRLRPPLPREAGLQGPGGQVQRARCAGWSTASAAARTWAASAWPAPCPASPTSTCPSWRRTSRRRSLRTRRVHLRAGAALPCAPQLQKQVRQGAGLAHAGPDAHRAATTKRWLTPSVPVTVEER